MKISNSLGLEIWQLELPFIEPWIEQLELQIETDAEVSNYLADLMHITHV